TTQIFITIYLTILALVVLVRFGRYAISLRKPSVKITYETGQSARGFVDNSLLDVSRNNYIEHKAACNGQGRCHTCKIAVVSGADSLSARSPLEAGLEDPAHRLACQSFILKDARHTVEIMRVEKDSAGDDYLQMWNLLRHRPPVKRKDMVVEADGG
ncbi:MAG: 2Fe-2S iron-sulfur cluster-binding protein, partial [Pseudomonadota bacterium]